MAEQPTGVRLNASTVVITVLIATHGELNLALQMEICEEVLVLTQIRRHPGTEGLFKAACSSSRCRRDSEEGLAESLQGWAPSFRICPVSATGQGTRLRQVELFLASGCSSEEPLGETGTRGQAQCPSRQVHVQAGIRSPPQKVRSHLCGCWPSTVYTGGGAHSCLD